MAAMTFDAFLRKMFDEYGALFGQESHAIFIPVESAGNVLSDLFALYDFYLKDWTPSVYLVMDLIGIDAVNHQIYLDFAGSDALKLFGFGLQCYADMCRMLEAEVAECNIKENA